MSRRRRPPFPALARELGWSRNKVYRAIQNELLSTAGTTNAKLAMRHGVSIRTIQRLRKKGKLQETAKNENEDRAGVELALVEEPLAQHRLAMGHKILRQIRCPDGGVVDIYDLTTCEIIECKARGSCGSLAAAVGQLQRHRKIIARRSLLTVAVPRIDNDAELLAQCLRGNG
jgi:hypothetical protein